MTKVLFRFILPIIFIVLFISSSFAQQSTVDRLERRIAELEKRVAVLEEKLSITPSQPIQYSEKWKDHSL